MGIRAYSDSYYATRSTARGDDSKHRCGVLVVGLRLISHFELQPRSVATLQPAVGAPAATGPWVKAAHITSSSLAETQGETLTLHQQTRSQREHIKLGEALR